MSFLFLAKSQSRKISLYYAPTILCAFASLREINYIAIENQNNITIEKIVISDISGKMVYYIEKPINTINLENLTRGMYLVNIFTSDKKECFKILKED